MAVHRACTKSEKMRYGNEFENRAEYEVGTHNCTRKEERLQKKKRRPESKGVKKAGLLSAPRQINAHLKSSAPASTYIKEHQRKMLRNRELGRCSNVSKICQSCLIPLSGKQYLRHFRADGGIKLTVIMASLVKGENVQLQRGPKGFCQLTALLADCLPPPENQRGFRSHCLLCRKKIPTTSV
jgi:hypothetical protein